MITQETIVVSSRVKNNAHILSSGIKEVVLLGTSDTLATEQLVDSSIPLRASRGVVRVLVQVEFDDVGNFLESGVGQFSTYVKINDDDTFDAYVIHNLPNGISRTVNVSWFAFGYEAEE